MEKIPFNKPYEIGSEIGYIQRAIARGQIAGDGEFTRRCSAILSEQIGCLATLLTTSCTDALEMAAILLDISPGDEVILPSYTFVSTANAFVLRGAIPVFVDIRPDTLNIDERKLESALTSRSRAVIPVHYAGIGCEMDEIMAFATDHNIAVVEDAAQAISATYKNRALGSIGQIGAMSFHATKNVIAGECGALLLNEKTLIERAEIVREKGTNRSQFLRSKASKYSWQDLGSSYLPSELVTAFLYAQLREADNITATRIKLWEKYHNAFKSYENLGRFTSPQVPEGCQHNGHMYYLLTNSRSERDDFIRFMATKHIECSSHYEPLHSSSFGSQVGRVVGSMVNTESCASRIVRLPLWNELGPQQDRIIQTALEFFS